MYDINKIRNDFPILSREVYGKPLIYLDNGATTQKPLCVVDAMRDEYFNVNANVHRGVHYLSQQATDLHEAARETVRKFINAKSTDEVIFTRGTTESINLVVSSFCDEFMKEGDEVIISAMEHHSNIVPWQMQAAKKGIAIRIIPISESGELDIEEYKKLKQSIITQAVTKGIRPNRKMKDSGIEWTKEIPVDWNNINPKALFTQRKEKASAGEKQLTASQQYGIVYQDEYMEMTGAKVVTVEKDFDILKHVEKGDFVISMRSFQGGLEYSTKTGSISSAYVMLIPNEKYVFPRFYRWLLKSNVYINALQSTSNMVRDGQAMRYSNFAQVRLYTVPLKEQEEIANYLDLKCNQIDKLIEQKEDFLKELETYKKSLIYEYVTGKKEVK